MTSASTSAALESNPILITLGQRRSIYHVSKELPIDTPELCTLVKRAVRASERLNAADVPPSARVVVLLGSAHDAFWDMVAQQMQAIASPTGAKSGSAKLNLTVKAGAGTLLFFSDTRVEAAHAPKLARLGHEAEDMPALMGTRGVAAAEFAVWNALAATKIGATLHHYNVLIESLVIRRFQLPPWWRLQSQMPFGGITHPAGEKTSVPISERCIVYGMSAESSQEFF